MIIYSRIKSTFEIKTDRKKKIKRKIHEKKVKILRKRKKSDFQNESKKRQNVLNDKLAKTRFLISPKEMFLIYRL